MSIFKSLALTLALLASAAYADQVVLRDGHPDRYVVVKGDTLWDISENFLASPWLWPEIWYVNPQIDNPHLIYPGVRGWQAAVTRQARQRHFQAVAKSTR